MEIKKIPNHHSDKKTDIKNNKNEEYQLNHKKKTIT